MGIGKTIGYILALIGIVLIATGTIDPLKTALKLESVKSMYLMVAGLVIVLIGIIPIFKSDGSGKASEVPIYQGKNVVGFRRIGK